MKKKMAGNTLTAKIAKRVTYETQKRHVRNKL